MESMLVDKFFGGDGEIVRDGDLLYTCTLAQTDIGTNKNKFYIIQLIHTGKGYQFFTRYGRTGENGTSNKNSCGLDDGKELFKRQFKTKTGNIWTSDVYEKFTQKKGKYYLLQLDTSELEKIKKPEKKDSVSKLDTRVQDLIKLLTDRDMIGRSLGSLNIDTKKAPLGKISKKQIESAKKILEEINHSIQNKKDGLVELSSQYYTLIPCSFGRGQPPTIKTSEMVGDNMRLLEELENISITVKIAESVTTDDENILDKMYRELNTEITPIGKDSNEWKMIKEYMKIASTHNCGIELIDMYHIAREGEKDIYDAYTKEEDIGNHQLLWHGSGLSNWYPIMKTGFRLPHMLKGVYISGAMFGGGVYFSNMFSKSVGYTRWHDFDGYACLMLNVVALGKQYEKTEAECDITKSKIRKLGYDSTYGRGSTTTKMKYKINDKIYVPAGETIKYDEKTNLLYDEFIVYDTKQIMQKYLVVVKVARV